VIARVDEGIRRGVVWAPSVWWTKLTPDGRNANETTSQRETDLGGGATFYDNQVDVSLAS
jgi:anaerobic selenocysteine-containing dehydrogenase